jgi:hypothetical protein
MARRFQFSLRNLLGATTCFAISIGAYAILQQDPPSIPEIFWPLALMILIASPAAGIGVLAGRPLAGLIYGIVAAFLALWLLLPDIQ